MATFVIVHGALGGGWEWSAVPQYIRDRGITFPPFGPEHLTNSLHHLAELAAPASRA